MRFSESPKGSIEAESTESTESTESSAPTVGSFGSAGRGESDLLRRVCGNHGGICGALPEPGMLSGRQRGVDLSGCRMR